MAVADVFTALTEDRPYRAGMSQTEAMEVIDRMVVDRALDGDIVALLAARFGEVNAIRTQAQDLATREYERIRRSVHRRVEG